MVHLNTAQNCSINYSVFMHIVMEYLYLPVVFCLLSNENKDTYLAVWEILQEKCSSSNKFCSQQH